MFYTRKRINKKVILMTILQNKPIKIKYTKETGETSERTILSTTYLPENVKAIDISEFGEEDIQDLQANLEEYEAYKALMYNKLYNFEDWLEHTKNVKKTLKWRTFKLSRMEILG